MGERTGEWELRVEQALHCGHEELRRLVNGDGRPLVLPVRVRRMGKSPAVVDSRASGAATEGMAATLTSGIPPSSQCPGRLEVSAPVLAPSTVFGDGRDQEVEER